jgi:hypothetical protein
LINTDEVLASTAKALDWKIYHFVRIELVDCQQSERLSTSVNDAVKLETNALL